jgi:hypothetical protein
VDSDDPFVALGEVELRELLEGVVVLLEEAGFSIDRAAILVDGRLQDGEPFKGVQSVGADDEEAATLVGWGFLTLGQKIGLLPPER